MAPRDELLIAGIALCLVSVVLLALGVALQKMALTVMSATRLLSDSMGGCRLLPGCATRVRTASATWLGGLFIYFLGNGVFVVALSVTPASLAAALMALIVVVNALLSRFMLRETLKRCDYHGGALITSGIALTAWYAPSEVITYDAPAIASLFSPFENPAGCGYFLLLGACTLALAVLVLTYEAAQPSAGVVSAPAWASPEPSAAMLPRARLSAPSFTADARAACIRVQPNGAATARELPPGTGFGRDSGGGICAGGGDGDCGGREGASTHEQGDGWPVGGTDEGAGSCAGCSGTSPDQPVGCGDSDCLARAALARGHSARTALCTAPAVHATAASACGGDSLTHVSSLPARVPSLVAAPASPTPVVPSPRRLPWLSLSATGQPAGSNGSGGSPACACAMCDIAARTSDLEAGTAGACLGAQHQQGRLSPMRPAYTAPLTKVAAAGASSDSKSACSGTAGPHKLDATMPFAYPIVIGCLETQVCGPALITCAKLHWPRKQRPPKKRRAPPGPSWDTDTRPPVPLLNPPRVMRIGRPLLPTVQHPRAPRTLLSAHPAPPAPPLGRCRCA